MKEAWEEAEDYYESCDDGRPKCACCGDAIHTDKVFKIYGEYWCANCIDDCEVSISDVMDDLATGNDDYDDFEE